MVVVVVSECRREKATAKRRHGTISVRVPLVPWRIKQGVGPVSKQAACSSQFDDESTTDKFGTAREQLMSNLDGGQLVGSLLVRALVYELCICSIQHVRDLGL